MERYPYLEAREGREHQLYDGDTRLVVGCVPIKGNRFLLISSSKVPNKWVLPKGGWEDGESVEEAAKRETFEESGVTGSIGEEISSITYSTKEDKTAFWRLFVMQVEKEYDWWPEISSRQRKWVSESDISSLNICKLTKTHLPSILNYIHDH